MSKRTFASYSESSISDSVSVKASEYLKNVKPIIEINPAKYYQLLFEKNNYGGIPKNPSYNFIFNQETNNPENVLPVVGVIKEKQDMLQASI